MIPGHNNSVRLAQLPIQNGKVLIFNFHLVFPLYESSRTFLSSETSGQRIYHVNHPFVRA